MHLKKYYFVQIYIHSQSVLPRFSSALILLPGLLTDSDLPNVQVRSHGNEVGSMHGTFACTAQRQFCAYISQQKHLKFPYVHEQCLFIFKSSLYIYVTFRITVNFRRIPVFTYLLICRLSHAGGRRPGNKVALSR